MDEAGDMKVHFFQDNSFFRTAKGTNPFFDPIIQVCEENGIEWKVFTYSPCAKCGYPLEKMGYFGRYSAFMVWVWRVVHLVWRAEVWQVWGLFGRLMRPFCRKRFEADLFVTIAGNMSTALAGMFPQTRLVDLQHGIIHSAHGGYFQPDGRLKAFYRAHKQIEFWRYGQGYVRCHLKHPANCADLEGRIKVIGDVFGQADRLNTQVNVEPRQYIVVSLQFTSDFSRSVFQSWEKDLCKYLELIQEEGLYKHYQVVLKHHPRYNGCYDIVPMLNKFPWLSISDMPHSELKKRAMYHITYMSTTAFEYAAAGVPTLFTESDSNRLGVEIFYDEFNYPLPLSFNTLRSATECVEEWKRQSKMVKEWQRRFYEPVDMVRIRYLLEFGANDVALPGR